MSPLARLRGVLSKLLEQQEGLVEEIRATDLKHPIPWRRGYAEGYLDALRFVAAVVEDDGE